MFYSFFVMRICFLSFSFQILVMDLLVDMIFLMYSLISIYVKAQAWMPSGWSQTTKLLTLPLPLISWMISRKLLDYSIPISLDIKGAIKKQISKMIKLELACKPTSYHEIISELNQE